MPGESVPAYLQNRFDTKTTRLYSYAWIVYGFLYIPIQLKTVASIIQIVLPGMNMMAAMLIGVTVAVLYTSFSGMKGASAVGRVVCIGIYILLIIFTVTTLSGFGGLGGLFEQLPENYNSMGEYADTENIAWILGGCISTAVMQAVLQPLFGGKKPSGCKNRFNSGLSDCGADLFFYGNLWYAFQKLPVQTWATVRRLLHMQLKTFSSPCLPELYLPLRP